MAFPVVTSRATGRTTASNTASHPITIPAGSVGERIVVALAVDGQPTVTVGTGTGWTKLGQHTQAGGTVTAAIFTKIADGNDALTLATSANEQSSHAVIRMTGGAVLEGVAADGNSTNSNPPRYPAGTATFGAPVEGLWLAVRAGDSTTLATVAPSGFFNILTGVGTGFNSLAAAGGQGASINMVEWGQETVTFFDPAPFTSASEQWVCYTLVAYDLLTAQADFSAEWSIPITASRDFSAVYAITGETAGGQDWFPRLTDGWYTWGAVVGATLTAQRDYSGTWNLSGTVTSDYSPLWGIASSGSGTQDLAWFERVTDGHQTWSERFVVIDPGVGAISGDVLVPWSAYEDHQDYWDVLTSVQADRSVLYGILVDLIPVQNDYVASYQLEGSVGQNYSAQYNVLTTAEADRAAEWNIAAAVSADFTAEYDTETDPLTAGNNLTAEWDVIEAVEADLVGDFDILAAVEHSDLAAEWHVLSPVQADHAVFWVVADSPFADLEADYDLIAAPAADFVAVWNVADLTTDVDHIILKARPYGYIRIYAA